MDTPTDNLQISEQRYRGLVESQRDLVVRVDRDGRFQFVNDAYCRAFGKRRDELIGHTFMPLVHPDDRQTTLEAMKGLEVPPYRIYVEQRAMTVDGWRWLGWEDYAIKDERGETVEIQGVGRDITTYKEIEKALRESEARSQALLKALPDMMFVQSPDGVYIDYHVSESDQLLLPPIAFLGRSMSDVLPPDVAARFAGPFHETLRTGKPQVVEYSLDLGGDVSYYEARVAAVDDGNVLTIVRDITDRKRADQEMRNALQQERELSELKTRFVSMASHEFRTPLSAILSSAELIDLYGANLTEDRRRRYVDQIRSSARLMADLLQDILLIGKMDAGKIPFNPAPIDLDEFCRTLVEESRLTIHDGKTIHFDCQGSPPADGAWLDEKLLRQILGNLLSNAIKYSLPGGDIQFEVEYQPGTITFRIKDAGIGIPLEEQPALFESFYRASNTIQYAGTGLGLAIVKRSVSLHGGTIHFTSAPDQGACFVVTLPAAPGREGGSE